MGKKRIILLIVLYGFELNMWVLVILRKRKIEWCKIDGDNINIYFYLIFRKRLKIYKNINCLLKYNYLF